MSQILRLILLLLIISFNNCTNPFISSENSNSIIKDGVEYYLKTDKKEYYLGERVKVRYKIRNLNEHPVDIGIVTFQDYEPFVLEFFREYAFQFGNHTSTWGWEIVYTISLKPKQAISFYYNWNMTNINHTLVPDGGYKINAYLYTELDKRTPVSVYIKIFPSLE